MTTRRQFVAQAAAATVLGPSRVLGADAPKMMNANPAPATTDERAYWCGLAAKLATPVLTALAARKLKATMPVEAKNPKDRAKVTHLEALGRLLAGIAPWLELGADGEAGESSVRVRFADLAREGIDAATDPASPDYMNFVQPGQPLVDAAFLAEAILRAPRELWSKLPERVQKNVVAALAATRVTKPPEINWVLFASMVEAGMKRWGAPVDVERLEHGLERHRQWYLGDGIYGDGPEFHWDYYNAFVIQPMLVEVLDVAAADDPQWKSLHEQAQLRLGRFAAVQERFVAPDGSYPIVGRSITYRCGAFQGLALAALRRALPKELPPAQARTALTAVIRKTLEAPGTFDGAGWLQLGVCGHQPSLAEPYISTGSLYLCSVALLPLGLPASDPFWADAAVPSTSQKVWSGMDAPADHALAERHEKSDAPPRKS